MQWENNAEIPMEERVKTELRNVEKKYKVIV
jgi:hypothetical protein